MKSEKYPVSLPHYITEPLKLQMKEGVLEFPTMADAIRGTLLCQLLKGGCHPVSEKLAMMGKPIQDMVGEFINVLAGQGYTQKQRFLDLLIERAIAEVGEKEERELAVWITQDLVEMARRHKNGEDVVSELFGAPAVSE